MDDKKLIEMYIEFKRECINNQMIDLQEIIRLFEVQLKTKRFINSL